MDRTCASSALGISLLACLSIPPADADEVIQLVYFPKPGFEQRCSLRYEESSSTQGPLERQDSATAILRGVMKTRVEVELDRTVQAREAQVAALEYRFEKLAVKASLGDNELASPGHEKLSGQRLRLRLGGLGLLAEPAWPDRERLDASEWTQIQLLAGSLAAVVALSFPALPANPVAPGETWAYEGDLAAGLPGVPVAPLPVRSSLRLVGTPGGPDGKLATIEERLEAELSGPYHRLNAYVLTELKLQGSIQHQLDLGSGVPRSTQGQLSISIATPADEETGFEGVRIELQIAFEIAPR